MHGVHELLTTAPHEHCHEGPIPKKSNARNTCRVYGNYTFAVGDLVSYDSTLDKLVSSTAAIVDFIVVNISGDRTWVEVANSGVYSIGMVFENGILYNNRTGKASILTGDTSNVQCVGAVVNGFLLVNVNKSTGSGGFGQVNADWDASTGLSAILNKPSLFSGDYNDLTNTPTIEAPVNADWDAASGQSAILNKPSLFSGDYNDLSNKPAVTAQANADWNATSGISQILNKPSIFSGSYNDLANKPTLFSGKFDDLSGTPQLFDGNYNSLTNKPTIPDAYTLPVASTSVLGGVKVGSNLSIDANGILNASFTVDYADVQNKPNRNKILSIATPSIGDNILVIYTDSTIKLSAIKGIIQGDANSQVGISVYAGTDRRFGAQGTKLLTQGSISDFISGTALTVADADATVSANNFIYVVINNTVGNPTMLELIAIYGDA